MRVKNGFKKNVGSGVNMDIYESLESNGFNYERFENDLRSLMKIDDHRIWQYMLNIISDETTMNNLEVAQCFLETQDDCDGSFLMEYGYHRVLMRGELPENIKLTMRRKNESTLL